MAERVEYGRQIDCEANGCKVRHSDDGYVFEWPMREFGLPDLSEPPIVNGHACRWVQRHIPEWSPLVGERASSEDAVQPPNADLRLRDLGALRGGCGGAQP